MPEWSLLGYRGSKKGSALVQDQSFVFRALLLRSYNSSLRPVQRPFDSSSESRASCGGWFQKIFLNRAEAEILISSCNVSNFGFLSFANGRLMLLLLFLWSERSNCCGLRDCHHDINALCLNSLIVNDWSGRVCQYWTI